MTMTMNNEMMNKIPLVGYADRLSVRPNETISFHVSYHPITTTTTTAEEGQKETDSVNIKTSIVRVINADPHTPDGGVQTVPLEENDAGSIETIQTPKSYPIQLGSHAEIKIPREITKQIQQNGFTFMVNILPTLLPHPKQQKQQTIASIPSIFDLFINSTGCLTVRIRTLEKEQEAEVISERPLKINQWITVVCQATENKLSIGWKPIGQEEEEVFVITSVPLTTTLKNNDVDESAPKTATTLLLLACSRQRHHHHQQQQQEQQHVKHYYYENHFNGRMEGPKLWWVTTASTAEAESKLPDLTTISTTDFLPNPPTAEWDFSIGISTQQIYDTAGRFHLGPGKLINVPTRGVCGSHWSASEMCWRYAPSEYSAIHFHETDLSDCEWPVAYRWKVPATIKSGNYALLLKGATPEETDNIPFFVVPPKPTSNDDDDDEDASSTKNKVAVIVSTFTYVIYGNHARGEWIDDPNWESSWKQLVKTTPTAYPYNPRDYPQYGWSTYNCHADGSGICLTSWRRPLLNMRLGYITFPYPTWAGSGLRHYPADTHLTAWLENCLGQNYDIITDWELHTEGYEVLEPYRVVMTGSHPEYHSEASLKAFRDYKDRTGGRIMYLGGNGFYWKIAVGEAINDDSNNATSRDDDSTTNDEKSIGTSLPPDDDDQPPSSSITPTPTIVLEIRRGEGGVRAWASNPGEYYHQIDGGRYGGLWRRNGKPPQELVGVGFTAQGNFVGSYYKISAKAKSNPRISSWMFQGIDLKATPTIIGRHGLSGYGAAGFELDRMDVGLGTPDHAIVVASSEGHEPSETSPWILVFEERLTHHGNLVGVPDAELMRADIVFFETPKGGAIFSTGSITYCGSLLTNNGQNDISTLTRNVLNKFLDPNTIFSIPQVR